MASSDVQILVAGAAALPVSYQVPNAQELEPLAVAADFNGAGAGGSFLPTLVIQSDAGLVVARVPVSNAVAAGGSASVTWAPFLRGEAASSGGGVGPAYHAVLAGLSAYGLKGETPCPLWLVNGNGDPFATGSTSLMGTIFPFGFVKGDVLTGMVVEVARWGVTPGASVDQLALCDSTGTIVAVTPSFSAALTVGGPTRVPLKVPFSAPYTVPTDGLALYALQFEANHWSTQPLFYMYTPSWPLVVSSHAWLNTMGAPPPIFYTTPFAAFPLALGQVVDLNGGNGIGNPVWNGVY